MHSNSITLLLLLSYAVVNNCDTPHWRGDEVPNPTTDARKCGFDTTGRVCDPDTLLTPQLAKELRDHLKQIEDGKWVGNVTRVPEYDPEHFCETDTIKFEAPDMPTKICPFAHLTGMSPFARSTVCLYNSGLFWCPIEQRSLCQARCQMQKS
jgi:hypothetical protein